MVGPYKRHLFVCINERDPSDPRGCCADKRGVAVRDAFKKAIKSRNLDHKIRANKAGCLDGCARGVVAVVYPEGVWYQDLGVKDVDEIVEQHLINGQPVTRLTWAGPDADLPTLQEL